MPYRGTGPTLVQDALDFEGTSVPTPSYLVRKQLIIWRMSSIVLPLTGTKSHVVFSKGVGVGVFISDLQ